MLYILFGRSQIGKREVREHLAKTYGLIIIPKFTDDKHKNWKVRSLLRDGTFSDSLTPFKTDTFTNVQLRNDFVIKQRNLEQAKLNAVDSYVCAKSDDYLKYFFAEPQSPVVYDISKEYEGESYSARYYIKREHIENAINDSINNYILVCFSGKAIKEIEDIAQSKSKKDVVKLIFVDGTPKRDHRSSERSKYVVEPQPLVDQSDDSNKTKPEDQPAPYFLENSHKFRKITNWPCCYTGGSEIDKYAFSAMIEEQWESICRLDNKPLLPLLPLKMKCFLVRPFQPSKEDCDLSIGEVRVNINDLFQNALEKKVKQILTNQVEFVTLSNFPNDNLFERIKKAITSSHIIFVDLRYHRSNCYYEYGYAMALATKLRKEIFCLIGVKSGLSANEAIDNSIKESWPELKDTLDKIAFDVTEYPYFKYTHGQPEADHNGRLKIEIEFMAVTNQEQNLDSLLSKFNRSKVDINKLLLEDCECAISRT